MAWYVRRPQYLEAEIGPWAKEAIAEWDDIFGATDVTNLNEDNFHDELLNSTALWLVITFTRQSLRVFTFKTSFGVHSSNLRAFTSQFFPWAFTRPTSELWNGCGRAGPTHARPASRGRSLAQFTFQTSLAFTDPMFAHSLASIA
jgi:hypothetical protein